MIQSTNPPPSSILDKEAPQLEPRGFEADNAIRAHSDQGNHGRIPLSAKIAWAVLYIFHRLQHIKGR
jgi:hypothetical protein